MLSGKENLMGSQYDDTRMGDGNDNVLVGAGGHDTIIGGAGSDTVSYASASASVTVNLQIGSGSGGDAEGDTYIDIANVIGSSYGALIIGGLKAHLTRAQIGRAPCGARAGGDG